MMTFIRKQAVTLLTGITLIALAIATMPDHARAQERGIESPRVSPNAVVSQTIGTTKVTITYGRPAVRDRLIFGELVPFGEIWRTGANEATTIAFSDDVLVEGEPVDTGVYSLFTIPEEDGPWTLVLNDIAEQWGAYDYQIAEDVIRVEIDAEEAPFMEQMMFYFEDVQEDAGTAVLHWDTIKVSFRIEER